MAWGLLVLLTGQPLNPPAIFAVAMGASVLIVTLLFILPEFWEELPVELPMARPEGRSRLSVDDMKEYLELLEQAEEKWLRHVTAVTQERAAHKSGPSSPTSASEPAANEPTPFAGFEPLAIRRDPVPPGSVPTPSPSTPAIPSARPSIPGTPLSEEGMAVRQPTPRFEPWTPPVAPLAPGTHPESRGLSRSDPLAEPGSSPGPGPLTLGSQPVMPKAESGVPKIEHPPASPVASASRAPALSKADEVVEAEVLAFHTALSTGIPRRQNEDAAVYVNRINHMVPPGLGASPIPSANAVGESVAEDLLEAHRTLSPRNLALLGEAVESRVNEVGSRVGVLRGKYEDLSSYATRIKAASRSPVRVPIPVSPLTPVPAASPPASSGGTLNTILHSSTPISQAQTRSLTWALALYRGFLQNYFSAADIDRIAKEVEAESPWVATSPRSENDLLTYSRLLKNAIIASQRTASPPIDVNRVLREFDQFVEMLKETAPK